MCVVCCVCVCARARVCVCVCVCDSDVKYLLVVSLGNTFVATHVWLNLNTLLSIYGMEKSRF